jgi:hypothetical protein
MGPADGRCEGKYRDVSPGREREPHAQHLLDLTNPAPVVVVMGRIGVVDDSVQQVIVDEDARHK